MPSEIWEGEGEVAKEVGAAAVAGAGIGPDAGAGKADAVDAGAS